MLMHMFLFMYHALRFWNKCDFWVAYKQFTDMQYVNIVWISKWMGYNSGYKNA